MKVHLLVHRWFAEGGAGWSCHPELINRLFRCQIALTNQLSGDPGPVGPIIVEGESLFLVGLRVPDPDRAVDDRGRPVVVFCAAAFPAEPDSKGVGVARAFLQTMT